MKVGTEAIIQCITVHLFFSFSLDSFRSVFRQAMLHYYTALLIGTHLKWLNSHLTQTYTTSCLHTCQKIATCVCHWTPTTAFVGHRHMPSAANQHTFWRSLICCCWTSSMEQSANPAASLVLHSDNFNEHSKCIYSVSQKSSPPKNFLRYFHSWWTCVIANYLVYCQSYSYIYTSFGSFI